MEVVTRSDRDISGPVLAASGGSPSSKEALEASKTIVASSRQGVSVSMLSVIGNSSSRPERSIASSWTSFARRLAGLSHCESCKLLNLSQP
jgi:hypothetical protein